MLRVDPSGTLWLWLTTSSRVTSDDMHIMWHSFRKIALFLFPFFLSVQFCCNQSTSALAIKILFLQQYFSRPFPYIRISLLPFTTTTWLYFRAMLLFILLLLLNYLALNSGCFHADIHSKRAIHNHNNQGSLGDTLLVLRSQAHSFETWLILIWTVFCCSPILTLIPNVSVHCPSVLVTLSKAPTTSGAAHPCS